MFGTGRTHEIVGTRAISLVLRIVATFSSAAAVKFLSQIFMVDCMNPFFFHLAILRTLSFIKLTKHILPSCLHLCSFRPTSGETKQTTFI